MKGCRTPFGFTENFSKVLEKGKNIGSGVRAISGRSRSAIKYSLEAWKQRGIDGGREMEDEKEM